MTDSPKKKEGSQEDSASMVSEVDDSFLSATTSLCPKCLEVIPAYVFERDGKVWITKTCPKHGVVEDLYWGDADMYRKAKRFEKDGRGVTNPQIKKDGPIECPKDCGLCAMHKSHTALANIALTTRCDRNCWYCFFYAGKLGYVYEPSMGQIREMLSNLRNEKPVSCNAIQLSLDANERIFVRNHEGIIFSEKIGEFTDRIMKFKEPIKLKNPIQHEKTDLNVWEVLTLGDDNKSVFRPIKSIIRHKNKQNLFKLETDCGWSISTTGSHSVFVLDNGNIVSKAVKDIINNDVLLGSLDFPLKKKIKEIDLLKLIEKKRPDVLNRIVITGFPKSALKYFEKIEKRRIGWDTVAYSTYSASHKRHGKLIRYFNSMKGKELPIKLKITPELCRLLGYYIGEGCSYKSGVIFSFSIKERQMIEDFEHCVRKVFGNTNIRKTKQHDSAMQIYIEGYLYKLFFDVLGTGKRAKEKRIPWLIYNVSDRLKKEFLRAYFKCDGNVRMRKAGFEITHNTVSKDLASDLVWIHLNFGVVPKIETSMTKPHLVKKTGQFIKTSSKKRKVVINGKENLSKVLWYLDGEVLSKFRGYILSKERHSPSYMRIPIDKNIKSLADTKVLDSDIAYLLKRARFDTSISKSNVQKITDYFNNNNIDFDKRYNDLSHGSLGFFKVRKIKKVKPNSEYVYDLSVPKTEAFFAGMGPLLAHNTGGEPTLRKDLIDIIKLCKEEGFDHVQLNTNGIRISQDVEFARKIREAGVNTLYLSFDGMTPKTNVKNHWEIPGTLENCRKVGLRSVLVPTVIRGVNDDQLGDIIRFGVKNIDAVSGINFQPVSLVGMMPRKERDKHRITIPDAIKKIEEQTKGQVGKEDFYPVPTVSPITNFVEAITGEPKYHLSSHFACGMATYLFIDEKTGKYIPITRFVDVEGLLQHLDEKAEAIKSGKNKYITSLKLLYDIRKFVDKEKQPSGMNISKMIYGVLAGKGKYNSLLKMHYKSLFIGMMHFQDLYNYDIERVKRCCIHYAMTDGRIIPFCAFNVIPEWYRDASQKSQGISIKKWEKETGKTLKDDLYKRDIKALTKDKLYKKTYRGFVKGVR